MKFSRLPMTVAEALQKYHTPVMLHPSCDALNIVPNGLYVDCTLGGGSHTEEILRRGGRVIGLDQDREAIDYTSNRLSSFLQNQQLEIIHTNFQHVHNVVVNSRLFQRQLEERKVSGVDGVLMDLGVSSYQINVDSRGFAFGMDGPLDMRMNQRKENDVVSELTAHVIVNTWTLENIANTLYQYGDEIKSRQIAREIVLQRPINSTSQLAEVIGRVTPWKHRPQTLARCFQALRIVVNDEMSVLRSALNSVHKAVRPGGRLAVLSYHSLEDRQVKQLLRSGHSDNVFLNGVAPPAWRPVNKKALIATTEEIAINSRSRSAKLRIGERVNEDGVEDSKTTNNNKISILGKKQQRKLQRQQQEEAEEEEKEEETRK